MFIDFDEMSLQWGMHQVVFMNTVHNDGDTGSIRFEPTPTFNQYTLDRRWIVSVCAAGMLESEMDVRIEHLQDGVNVLVISGESKPRPIGEDRLYLYKRFQKSLRLPSDALPGSMVSSFASGLMLIMFDLERS